MQDHYPTLGIPRTATFAALSSGANPEQQARRDRTEREARATQAREVKEQAEKEAHAQRARQAREGWEREILENQEREAAKQGMIVGANAYTQQNASPRKNPYIWVSWLSKLLAGSNSCEWAAWFKTRYEGSSWKKVESDFDLKQWQVDHTALCVRETIRLEDTGAKVKVEDRNSFNLNLGNVTIGGKPDLVSLLPDGTILVQDCKTGKPRPEHKLQVMLYMWVLPLAFPELREATFHGQVIYRESTESVCASEVDDNFVLSVKELIDRLANEQGARRAPSLSECRFCDIPSLHCNDRIE